MFILFNCFKKRTIA